MIRRPTDRRIPQLNYSYQPVNPNLGRMPQQPQGGGFLSGMSNTAKAMSMANKASGGKMASGLKSLANKGLGALGMPTFSMPTSAAAPIAANASPAASELALAAQSAGYAPEFGVMGGAAAPTAASIASGATSMGSPAASLAAAEAAQGAGTAGSGFMSGVASAMPVLGAIGAGIQFQNALTMDNDRVFEGHQTGDFFSGDYATEPWLGWAGNKLGTRISPGEAFDAARANGEESDMWKRLPSVMDQWSDPVRNLSGNWSEKVGGKALSWAADPIGNLWRSLW